MRITPTAPVPDWSELESALDASKDGPCSRYYDRQTGAVHLLFPDDDYDPEGARALAASIEEAPERFIRIEPTPSRIKYEWMERYVRVVGDARLADRLARDLGGKGSFRRFHEVLNGAGKQQVERWYAFSRTQLRRAIVNWLDEHDVEVGEAPPWPDLAEDDDASRPADDLRRLAHACIDRLPDDQLPRIAALLQDLAAPRT